MSCTRGWGRLPGSVLAMVGADLLATAEHAVGRAPVGNHDMWVLMGWKVLIGKVGSQLGGIHDPREPSAPLIWASRIRARAIGRNRKRN